MHISLNFLLLGFLAVPALAKYNPPQKQALNKEQQVHADELREYIGSRLGLPLGNQAKADNNGQGQPPNKSAAMFKQVENRPPPMSDEEKNKRLHEFLETQIGVSPEKQYGAATNVKVFDLPPQAPKGPKDNQNHAQAPQIPQPLPNRAPQRLRRRL